MFIPWRAGKLWGNHETTWSLIIDLGCASGALNLFSFIHRQTSQRRLANAHQYSISCHSHIHRFTAGVTPPPLLTWPRLAMLAHYLRERLISLWLCRPVHLWVPLAPPNQKGQGTNNSGPQPCAESAWMKNIAWGHLFGEGFMSALAFADDWRIGRVYSDWSECLTCILPRMWYGQSLPPRHEIILWWKTTDMTSQTSETSH